MSGPVLIARVAASLWLGRSKFKSKQFNSPSGEKPKSRQISRIFRQCSSEALGHTETVLTGAVWPIKRSCST
jgi:hypothetical protein